MLPARAARTESPAAVAAMALPEARVVLLVSVAVRRVRRVRPVLMATAATAA